MEMEEKVRAEILRASTAHGAIDVRVFGSRARGDARPDSDIDLLVTFQSDRDLFDLVAMKQELEDALGFSVDVVTPSSLSPYLRQRILAEAVPLH